jgi:hypothetical protein
MKKTKPTIHASRLKAEYSVRWYSCVQIAWIEFEKYNAEETAREAATMLKARMHAAGEAARVAIVKIVEEEVKG